MAIKKPTPKPLSLLRFEFVESMENVCQQSIMLLQIVSTLLQHEDAVKQSLRGILRERHDALRNALIGPDDAEEN